LLLQDHLTMLIVSHVTTNHEYDCLNSTVLSWQREASTEVASLT